MDNKRGKNNYTIERILYLENLNSKKQYEKKEGKILRNNIKKEKELKNEVNSIKIGLMARILLLTFCLTINGNITVYAKENESLNQCTDIAMLNKELYTHIPNTVYEYANDNFIDFCKASEADLPREIDYSSIEIMKPFIIYNVDNPDVQKADFYFPIKDKDGIILIFQVIETDLGMSGCASLELTDLINETTYDQTIFYRLNGKTYVDNAMLQLDFKQSNELKNNYSSREKKFCSSSMKEKVKIISKNTKEFQKIQINKLKKEDTEALQEYTPGFSAQGVGKKVCDTGKYMVSQGSEPICWAACVASTYNYFFNKHITAKSVSKNILGEYKGTNSKTVVKAFAKYNMDVYKHGSYSLSYDNIKLSISHMRLLTMVGYNGILKHDVVLTGYSYSTQSKKIKIYDPSDNVWKWIVYEPGNTVFSSSGGDYLWNETYYVYK